MTTNGIVFAAIAYRLTKDYCTGTQKYLKIDTLTDKLDAFGIDAELYGRALAWLRDNGYITLRRIRWAEEGDNAFIWPDMGLVAIRSAGWELSNTYINALRKHVKKSARK